jgi:hypothetical protein
MKDTQKKAETLDQARSWIEMDATLIAGISVVGAFGELAISVIQIDNIFMVIRYDLLHDGKWGSINAARGDKAKCLKRAEELFQEIPASIISEAEVHQLRQLHFDDRGNLLWEQK